MSNPSSAHSRRSRIACAIFFSLTTLEGLFSLAGVLALPQSEEHNAIIGGLSLLRLAMLVMQGLGVLFFGIAGGFCFARPLWAEAYEAKMRVWFENHPFSAAALMSLMAAWTIGVTLLEVLLNPTLFPRAILYLFLYVRIRPLMLWGLAFSIQGITLALYTGWFVLFTTPPQPLSPAKRRGIAGLCVTLVLNLALWLVYTQTPESFAAWKNGMLVLICTAFILMLTSLHALNRPTSKK